MVKLDFYNHEEAYEYGITNLPNLEPIVEIIEKCNCYVHGSVKHVDGGNYHSIVKLFEITPNEFIVCYGDTRELFDISERIYVVIQLNNEVIGYITLKAGEVAEVITKEEAKKLLKYYEETEDYTVYVKA
jgi:hypothetical protein